MAVKLHAHASTMPCGGAMSLCGWPAVLTTEEPDAVTCELCKRRMRDARAEQAEERGQLTGGAAYREAHAALSFLADVYLGQYQGPPLSTPRRATAFASTAHALASMVLADVDGWTMGSLGDPDRLEQLAGRMGGRATGEDAFGASSYLDAIVTVRAAWARAWLGVDPTPLTLDEARACTLLRFVGAEMHDAESGTQRRQLTPHEIAEAMVQRGLVVSPKMIGRITRHAGSAVYEYLLEREMVPAMRRAKGVESMAESITDNDLIGWEEIAKFLSTGTPCSVDTARRYARELEMPIYRFQNRVEARSDELREWRATRLQAVG